MTTMSKKQHPQNIFEYIHEQRFFLHVSVAVTLKIKQGDHLRNFYKWMGISI